MRRPAAVLAALAAAALLLVRRSRASRAERDLWTEATTPPDLR